MGVVAYRLALGDSLPAAIPSQSAESIRSTLGAALEVTATLPAHLRAQVEMAVRDAFLHGLRAGAI